MGIVAGSTNWNGQDNFVDFIQFHAERLGMTREEYMAHYGSANSGINEAKPGPDPYHRGLEDGEVEDKEDQIKKQADMDDDDPDAYKEMPGDKEAKEKGEVKTSDATKAYNKLYKEAKQMKFIRSLALVTEAEKYVTDKFKVGDKLKTEFGEWEIIETDYAPKKSFMAPFIFKGDDMKRVNIPNAPKTNKNAVGYKVTDGDKYPIIGFLYQYKDITKLATVGVDESKQSDELAIAINAAIEGIDDSMSYVDFAQAVGKVIRDEYGTHLYKEFKKEINKSLKERVNEADDKEQKSTDRGPLDDDAIETGLKKKAEESGVPIGIIRAVMRRGLAAWKSGHRPGANQQQWGYARVNAFLTKGEGTWGNADKDLAKEVRDGGHDKKLKKA